MFQCYLSKGRFIEKQNQHLQAIVNNLNHDVLYHKPTELLLDFLAKFAKELVRSLISDEGIYYLSSWLRRSNLNGYLKTNLGDPAVLDRFVPNGSGQWLRAQPRGVVCHWVAGNVPTLSIFSLVQSILAKNVNILRVPQVSIKGTLDILKVMGKISVSRNKQSLTGNKVLESISVVYCPSDDLQSNRELSMAADCKVVWGGKDAVKGVLSLEQKEHCENIVFGPKYSFAVMDSDSIHDVKIKKIAMDIITFQQEACSCPHVIFCERKNGNRRETANRLARHLAGAFENLSQKHPKPVMAYTDVMNARGLYWLDPAKEIVCSDELDWTILIDDELKLEEPVKYRTIFVKEVDDILDVVPLITSKVQTIGISVCDHDKKMQFCEAATRSGVARCVPFGMMNNYDTPWDGMLFIDRLVRWTSMRDEV